jgi:hypothetical protein
MEQGATVKAQEGIWTLTAPDGREWKAESPLRAVAQESWERIPPTVALERIYAAAAEVPMPPWEDEANALIDALLDAARKDGILRQIKLAPVARCNLLDFMDKLADKDAGEGAEDAPAIEVIEAWRTSPLRSHDGRLFDAVAALAESHGIVLDAGDRPS